jgi:hypothetical protein
MLSLFGLRVTRRVRIPELVRSEAHRFLGGGLRHTAGLRKHHRAGTDHSHPRLDGTFTFTHPGFGRAGGDRLVRENADPDLAFALEGAVDRDTAGLDLAVGDPAAVEALQAEVAEGDGRTDLGVTRSGSRGALLRNLTRLGIRGMTSVSCVRLEMVTVSYGCGSGARLVTTTASATWAALGALRCGRLLGVAVDFLLLGHPAL